MQPELMTLKAIQSQCNLN